MIFERCSTPSQIKISALFSIFQDCWSVTATFARKLITRAKPMATVSPAPAWRTTWKRTPGGNVYHLHAHLAATVIPHWPKQSNSLLIVDSSFSLDPQPHFFPNDRICFLSAFAGSTISESFPTCFPARRWRISTIEIWVYRTLSLRF